MAKAVVDRFHVCMPYVLAQECPLPGDWSNPRNFSNDPRDPGGRTMCGITETEYVAWLRKMGRMYMGDAGDVEKITEEDGYVIYRNNYWMPHCGDLARGLDLQFFDSSVNQGGAEAVRILQVALEITSDGVWGPATERAALGCGNNTPPVIEAFTARREAVYKMTKNFEHFGEDWLRRAAQIGATALQMATA